MIRFAILFGFAFMFLLLHRTGDLDKYINMRYAYLSVSAIVMLALLSLYQFITTYRMEKRREREQEAAEAAAAVYSNGDKDKGAHAGIDQLELALSANPDPDRVHVHHKHEHISQKEPHHDHPHAEDVHDHDHHAHDHHAQVGHHHDVHAHDGYHHGGSKLKRVFTYAVLAIPILTGIFLPVATLDSSFVKAKGFSFPTLEEKQKDPGYHQFLRPDTSVFYGSEGYAKVKNKELSEFTDLKTVDLTDVNYLKGMEVLYNFSDDFANKTISFDGFAYKGEQVDQSHYFVFRFGFIHCVADSGVFGMLVEFPKGTQFNNDDWLHVSGTLTTEFYQPFKQTIPVLKVADWKQIDTPKDPYVYRTF